MNQSTNQPHQPLLLSTRLCVAIAGAAGGLYSTEQWYAERGIPYRRGYLLHGAPGSGKTSLVCAIAGELRLPIYQLRLSGAGLDDEAFHRLLAGTARRAVVLLEDVDAAAGAAVGAASAAVVGTEGGAGARAVGSGPGSGGSAESVLTLPGLLNALDGVGAVDGRLLFMTCHRAESLEPALVRPGRIDRRLSFGPPDAAQAEALFRHFYGGAKAGPGLGPAPACRVSSETREDQEREKEEEEVGEDP